jgi:formylglycine-generating enzyme required for sulfatase activity
MIGFVVVVAACSATEGAPDEALPRSRDAGAPDPEDVSDARAEDVAARDASSDASLPECGTALGTLCADGKPCSAAADCASDVCSNGSCAAPTSSDGVKNGGETDVDCGGASPTAPRCAAGKGCLTGSDCVTETCREGVCAQARSCAQVNGGATCGPGEVGSPDAVHEDCCTALEVPRPAADGGPFMMDKYLITAGRMRVFLEAVSYDVRGWIASHRPGWWKGTGTSTWDALLPTNADEFLSMMTTGGSGCYIGAAQGQRGAPAFWVSAADLVRVVGGAPRKLTQAELDTKVMNCFRAPLFHALCAYDGGRLPSRNEWIAARTVNGVVRPYPWGSNGTDADRRARAVYDFDYFWPSKPAPSDNDQGGYLAAPGRFPLGNGPYGHADLLGSVENMGSQPATGGGVKGDGWFQFSFQEAEQPTHPYGQQIVGFGSGDYRPHWAVGARCVKLP